MQFAYTFQRGHGLNVVVIQSVPSVETHSGGLNTFSGIRELLQERCDLGRFGISAMLVESMGVRSGVDLADGESHFSGGINLTW